MLNRPSSGNTSDVLNSFRKKRQQRDLLIRYGSIGLVALGLIVLIIWLTSGSNAPLSGIFATDTPTPTLTFTPTNTSTPTITATITETATITFTPTPSAPFPYTVTEGDSLAVIVDKFGLGETGIKLILYLNPFNPETGGGIDPTTHIVYPGLVLQLPYPGMPLPTTTPIPADLPRGTEINYVVELGDTLAGIAAKFNSTEAEIIEANNIENANALFAGQLLVVPINLITATPTLPPTSTPITPTVPGQPTATVTRPAGVSVTGTPIVQGQCSFTESASFVSEVGNLVNTERTANGLSALSVNQKLVAAAKAHAVDMICNEYFSHSGLNGSTPEMRVKAQGYTATFVFEHLFALAPANGGTPLAAFNWWINDPEQRAQILSTNVTELGVAYVSSPDSLLGGYFVLVTAKP
ncbi:MAG TPA: LysM peptidoglycan-binding domain-containing protein [Anaerolineales bacterium]|nr:LysM peptidoglycan-binding domain-containing protein [Anaerolineales bacterium]HNQ93175.1 LysM peptidoglycan-binding domain-containing protein [Anaerolineales bacterium]HNS59379.1 LysM peptidoglycan-binding domain-containing protein [Anaerolineales bacterium]